ncbi:DUF4062 domain-containing protein [Priestia sp. SB1]|uniref:DUF4062 domain-containing protein n=1 Tax=Priestia sp. SB1 TaxID=3132359 RepID=UPI00316AF175
MKKKLQVFISSTYLDLQEERQVAVQSVLNAGHIPAGMELFKSGDQSQKETIKKWIDESDVYMLILGGRYGSIEKESGKSYTHWEYDYAGESGKPRFSIVISDDALQLKVKKEGHEVIEKENYMLYQGFKNEVLNKISKFYNDIKDIKLVVYESLKEYEGDKSVTGWVSGKELINYRNTDKENAKLLKENIKIKDEVKRLREMIDKKDLIGDYYYDEITTYLQDKTYVNKDNILRIDEDEGTLLDILVSHQNAFALGIDNRKGMSDAKHFIYYQVVPYLMSIGLMESVKLASNVQRVKLTKAGHKYLAIRELKKIKSNFKIN